MELLLIIIGVLLVISYVLHVNVKLFKKHSKKLNTAMDDLELLQILGKEVSSKLEMNELLPAIMEAFVKAGDVAKGSLMLYDEEKNILEIKESIGLSPRAVKNIKLRIGEGIAGRVAETKKPMLVNDTKYDMYYREFFPEDTHGRPREIILSLPLIFKDRVLGVVTLDAKVTGKQFIRNDERLLSILASQAAVAINNARMYEMAITDGLTKLYIQKYFLHRLKQEFDKAKRYGRSLSLLFLDIDDFKLFNDTHGHQIGDMALVHISKLIKKPTRSVDICARYGGDEFVIVLPETAKRKALVLAQRLCKSVHQSVFEAGGNQYTSTISIGVAEYTDNMSAPEELIEKADKYLYQAKEGGRNRIVS